MRTAWRAKGREPPRGGEPTLTAADWAEAALQLVAEKGLGALTVDALAARLGVTKGSFYWHFASRADLLAAALSRWEERATTDNMRGLDAIPDPRRRLELMLDAASQPPRSRSLYAALAEAAEDPVVRKVLNRVATRAHRLPGEVLRGARTDAGAGGVACGARVRRVPRTAAARARSAWGTAAGLVDLSRRRPRRTGATRRRDRSTGATPLAQDSSNFTPAARPGSCECAGRE